MRKFITALILSFAIATSGCASRTEYGECIGVADTPRPELVYKVSTRNAVVSIIFFETIFAPVVWLLSDFKCPVGVQAAK